MYHIGGVTAIDGVDFEQMGEISKGLLRNRGYDLWGDGEGGCYMTLYWEWVKLPIEEREPKHESVRF